MFNKIMKNMDTFKQVKKIQQETAEGTAEGGKIKVKLNGMMQVDSVNIEAELLTPENKEKIEKGVKSAADKAMVDIAKKLKKMPGMENLGQQ